MRVCVHVYSLSRVSRQDGDRGEVGAVGRERNRTTWLEHHLHFEYLLMLTWNDLVGVMQHSSSQIRKHTHIYQHTKFQSWRHSGWADCYLEGCVSSPIYSWDASQRARKKVRVCMCRMWPTIQKLPANVNMHTDLQTMTGTPGHQIYITLLHKQGHLCYTQVHGYILYCIYWVCVCDSTHLIIKTAADVIQAFCVKKCWLLTQTHPECGNNS